MTEYYRFEDLFPTLTLKVKLISETAKLPTKAHPGDLGYDLYASEPALMLARRVTKVSTGVTIEFSEGIGARIADRSSISTRENPLFVKAGVIDSGYRGEILVAMYNPNSFDIDIARGDKIAQLILQYVIDAEIIQVDSLGDTERGAAGFGSTGST